jgi:hypothetical protein
VSTSTLSRRASQRRRYRVGTRATLALTVLGFCLVQVSPALAAAPSFTWAGNGPIDEETWSLDGNWDEGSAPTAGESMGTLTFPKLTDPACAAEPEEAACYFAFNDLGGLIAEAIHIDDGNEYFIGGEPLTLGSGGLTASPAPGSSGADGDVIALPLRLGASQTWGVSGRGDGEFGANNLLLAGAVTGSGDALAFEVSGGPGLYFENNTEVGPVKIDGTDTSEPGVLNGFASLLGADLNGEDGEPVELSHILLEGSGAVGSLTTDDAEVRVGSGSDPEGGIQAASVGLDAESLIIFTISHTGDTPQQDYSQLTSAGAIALGNATIEPFVRPLARGEPCPALTPGQTFIFVSTVGSLTGAFSNAPEHGPEIPIGFAEDCTPTAQTMRIAYNENGAIETVTGTVEAQAKERQEARERQESKESQETKERQAAAATKQHEEEAAATKRHEEEAAKAGVLAAKEGSPDATIAGTYLQASSSGAVGVKISCPSGVSSCTGELIIRTLNAVSATAASSAKAKAILTLTSGSFSVAGGKVKTIVLHLSQKARALLARSHALRVRVSVDAHDPAGGAHAGQTIDVLRAPKTKRT